MDGLYGVYVVIDTISSAIDGLFVQTLELLQASANMRGIILYRGATE